MKTPLTNPVRSLLDHRVPRRIRDSRWFMFPFFAVWFKGRNIRTAMEFKRIAPELSAPEFREICRTVDNLGSSRETDTNPDALAFAMDAVGAGARSIADVGCGRGYVLRRMQRDTRFDAVRLIGCDILERSNVGRAAYVVGDVESLPFASSTFDAVLCFHTLEHTRDLHQAIAELKRIAKSQLIVIVPRQRRFYYTPDLHLQFFETPAELATALGVAPEAVRQFGSDLVAVVNLP